MNRRNFSLIVTACAFVLGGLFVLADNAGINANVVGYSGSTQSITSMIGLAMIVVSAVFFVFMINAGRIDLERIAREKNNTEEIKAKLNDQELEEKYNSEDKK